ncbi:protein kinase [Bosea sp. RAF48]|uniref:protein kinase domain-containing protein n=1 Tax=Bosea sp. RAF48 TaxID=3237480 RepID=UPI003F904BA9
MNSRKLTFYDLDRSMQAQLLLSRKDMGFFAGERGGFSGSILRFSEPNAYPAHTCVKIPNNKFGLKESATRFLREIKLQRSFFYHQYVHWPFDVDFVMGAPVAWFRFWDADLAQLIEDESFVEIERLSMMAYLSSAMIHCHSRGLVAHQDLKPENVFIRNLRHQFSGLSGEPVWKIPKLADFGSANLAQDKGIYRGTRPYMAPEQWSKRPLGEHSTVWSLGLMAYELLTGGLHPIGERTTGWRNKQPGTWNRWQKNDMWRRWRDKGFPVIAPLQNPLHSTFIAACLDETETKRPSLMEFQSRMIEFIRDLSPASADQVSFQIFHWDRDGERDHDWDYLDRRIEALDAQVAAIED